MNAYNHGHGVARRLGSIHWTANDIADREMLCTLRFLYP
jgi:hypothetical protein